MSSFDTNRSGWKNQMLLLGGLLAYVLVIYFFLTSGDQDFLSLYAWKVMGTGLPLFAGIYLIASPYWYAEKYAEFWLSLVTLFVGWTLLRTWIFVHDPGYEPFLASAEPFSKGFQKSGASIGGFKRTLAGIIAAMITLLDVGMLTLLSLQHIRRQGVVPPTLEQRLSSGLRINSTTRVLGWNVFGWGIYFLFSVYVSSGREHFSWPMELILFLPGIIGFYVCLKSSFRLLSEGRLVVAVLTTLGILLGASILRGMLFAFCMKLGFPPFFEGENLPDVLSRNSDQARSAGYYLGYAAAKSLRTLFPVTLISFIYGYALQAVRYQKQLRELSEQRQEQLQKHQELVTEVTTAKLQTLKYQINPHFLFNSLNFLYAQALPLSENLSRATLLLSEIMRYGLQESEETKVPLEQEIRHLQNFVEFNQLRFSNRLQVQFTVEGTPAFRRIMPLLLITFVENAYKYGELHEPNHPLQILLRMDTEGLFFSVFNKKRQGPKENSTGIGLDNIRKRLELAYPNRYTLVLNDEPQTYTAELRIKL